MHQIDGLCFLIFAERGLWNRFVPSLDGYIQDRLNNPVHVPKHGTVKALRLEAPPPELTRRVVEARLRPCLGELPPDTEPMPEIFPFTDEQVMRIARTEPTLRDMLQQFRHLFDHVVYGPDDVSQGVGGRGQGSEEREQKTEDREQTTELEMPAGRFDVAAEMGAMPPMAQESDATGSQGSMGMPATDPRSRISELLGRDEDEVPPQPEMTFKHVDVVEMPDMPPALSPMVDDVPMAVPVDSDDGLGVRGEAELPATADSELSPNPSSLTPLQGPEVPANAPFPPAVPANVPPAAVVKMSAATLTELWEQEYRAARRKLEPEGALTGATRELQAGLGAFLSLCHEHGVKVGPWRLRHVVNEWSYGDHPTYGVVTIAHWACKDAQPWKVGIGLFLARGAGKPKDLEVKLAVMDTEPAMVDHLILLRPEDDLTMTGKSKTLLADAERRGKHARLEPVSLDGFAQLYAFPRWIAAVREGLPAGFPVPNLADIVQEKCEKLLEQVCMPVQG